MNDAPDTLLILFHYIFKIIIGVHICLFAMTTFFHGNSVASLLAPTRQRPRRPASSVWSGMGKSGRG
jgi:hypothetical protein